MVAVLTQWPSCEAGTGGEMPSPSSCVRLRISVRARTNQQACLVVQRSHASVGYYSTVVLTYVPVDLPRAKVLRNKNTEQNMSVLLLSPTLITAYKEPRIGSRTGGYHKNQS